MYCSYRCNLIPEAWTQCLRVVFLCLLFVLSNSSAAAFSLNVSSSEETMIPPGEFVTIDDAISFIPEAETLYDGARIIIEQPQNGDELSLEGFGHLFNTSYQASSGILDIIPRTGITTAEELLSAFRAVQFRAEDAGAVALRQISFVIGRHTLYSSRTEHFYRFFQTRGNVTWWQARDYAQVQDYYGIGGYLITITSPEESNFIVSKVAGNTWIGASDEAEDGTWRWVTGPEAGTEFWHGNDFGEAVNGEFSNWSPGEPNNSVNQSGLSESYAHVYGNRHESAGLWNDYWYNGPVSEFLVEYGGMDPDNEPKLATTRLLRVATGLVWESLRIIRSYAADGTAPAPGDIVYRDAGITGVTAVNLQEINRVVRAAGSERVNTAESIQAIVDAVVNGLPDADQDVLPETIDPDDLDACNPDINHLLCDQDSDGVVNGDESQRGTSLTEPDTDSDGRNDGDEGVADSDDDGVIDALESRLADADADGVSDETDSENTNPHNDSDNDGISNLHETTVGTDPEDPADKPSDIDGDNIPDALDADRDGDGVPNDIDAFPDDASESVDTDGDRIGNNTDPDDDGDGYSDELEISEGSDPLNGNSHPQDLDGDRIPDHADPDRDGDGVLNEEDVFPDDRNEHTDTDGDSVGNRADPDDDNDGVIDEQDAEPLNPLNDSDNDGLTNRQERELGTDPLSGDSDGDDISDADEIGPDIRAPRNTDGQGPIDALDSDDDGDGVPTEDERSSDDDDDGIPDHLDADSDADNENGGDSDGDGIQDVDECGEQANCADSDKDGIPDHFDADSDGNGVDDTNEPLPLRDTDGDGIRDFADPDDDGDSVADEDEINTPENPSQDDTDRDGIPDFKDADSQNEAGLADPSGDSDGDGISDAEEYGEDKENAARDTDNDGTPDYMDRDSDNDGIPDAPAEVVIPGESLIPDPSPVSPEVEDLGTVKTGVGGGSFSTGLSFLLVMLSLFRSSFCSFFSVSCCRAGGVIFAFPLLGFSTSSWSGWWDDSNVYAAAGYGQSQLDPATSGTRYSVSEEPDQAWKLTGGWDWTHYLSSEVYYAQLGEAELSPGGSIGYRMSGLNMLFHYWAYGGERIDGSVALYFKGGVNHMVNDADDVSYETSSVARFTTGAGAELYLPSSYSVRFEFESYASDAAFVSLNLVKRFGFRRQQRLLPPGSVTGESAGHVNDIAGVIESLPATAGGPRKIRLRPLVIDRDEDGILDDEDDCAFTAAGASVGPKGCLIFPDSEDTLSVELAFDESSSRLTEKDKQILNELISALHSAPEVQLGVQVYKREYEQNHGPVKETSQDLSQARAEEISGYLQENNISPERIRHEKKSPEISDDNDYDPVMDTERHRAVFIVLTR